MKARRSWLILMVAVVVLCLAVWTGRGQTQNAKVQRSVWEYKTVPGRVNEEQLNELGSDGWELLAVTAGSQQAYYFKRAK